MAEVTRCGPGRPHARQTPLGRFSFRHLKPELRGGYRLVDLGGGQEYLQARILWGLKHAGAMSPLAFQGGMGPAVPVRPAEVLRGSRLRAGGVCRDDYDLRGWMRSFARQLRREGYRADGSVRDRRPVQTGCIRVRGMLHEARLSPHRDEVLGVRVEVDTRPPKGAVTETRLVRRHVSLRLHHHDRASLLASKLHAVLCRPWAKGRDIHDLAWYLGDPTWPPPNLAMLNAALTQSGAGRDHHHPLTAQAWRGAVAKRVRELPWDAIVADARPRQPAPEPE